ncbi:hypothetical protein BJV78DRAFT_1249362 [Lactifluus subvellereus]|nr:hypothetical protein BJV78DRAFT_1249362 [Lactifluus subvellereus]
MPPRSTPLSSSQSPAWIVRRASRATVPEAWPYPLRRRRRVSRTFSNHVRQSMDFQSTNLFSDTTSDIVEPKIDEYFLNDRVVRECESGHDLTFRLEEHCAILGTTDLLALIYEYEIDIATGIREVLDDDLEIEEYFDLGLFPRSVKAYANPHRGLTRAVQQPSADWFSRADWAGSARKE